MSDFTHHKNEERKKNDKHNKNENWGKLGVDTASLWSLKYLWSYPTKEEAYNHIKRDFNATHAATHSAYPVLVLSSKRVFRG
jgi:hypothetical protein